MTMGEIIMEEEKINFNNNNNEKMLEKSKSKSYAVRATKRLFKTLSFKTQQPAGKQQSKKQTVSYDDVPLAISFVPTFDSSTAADTHDTHHQEHMDDLSHMSPKNISEMMKEQDDYAANIIIDVDNHVDKLSHLSPQNIVNNEMMMKEAQEEECEDVLAHLSSTYIADMVKQQVEYNKLLLRTADDGVTERQTENETTLEKERDDEEDAVSIEEEEQWWVDTEDNNEHEQNPTPGSDDSDDVILSHLSSHYISDLMKKQQHVEKELMKKLLNVRQEIEEQQRQPQQQPPSQKSTTATSTTTPAEAAMHMDHHGTLLLNEKQDEDEEEAVSAQTVLFMITVSYLCFLFFVTDFASYQEEQQQDIFVEGNIGEEIVAKRMMSTVVASVAKKWMKKILHK